MFVDDDLVGQHGAVGGAKGFQLLTGADQFDAHGELGVGEFIAFRLNSTVIAVTIMRLMGDGIHETGRLGLFDELSIKRLGVPKSCLTMKSLLLPYQVP